MSCCWPSCVRLTRLIGREPWWIAGPSERLGAGGKTGPNPTDRRKLGSKHHVITDAKGIPLAAILTGANRHDVTQLLPLVAAIPPVRGKPGRPRRRPGRVQGDRAYGSEPHRKVLRSLGIVPVLAQRLTGHGSGLGVHRWRGHLRRRCGSRRRCRGRQAGSVPAAAAGQQDQRYRKRRRGQRRREGRDKPPPSASPSTGVWCHLLCSCRPAFARQI